MSKININHLIEAKKLLDAASVPLEGRSTTLLASQFPREFKKGINKVFGISIVWIDDLNE